jgi:hypothetical protein
MVNIQKNPGTKINNAATTVMRRARRIELHAAVGTNITADIHA